MLHFELNLAAQQPGQCLLDHVLSYQAIKPLLWHSAFAPVRPSELAANGPSRVGVITEIHGLENGVGEILDEINALEQAILSALN